MRDIKAIGAHTRPGTPTGLSTDRCSRRERNYEVFPRDGNCRRRSKSLQATLEAERARADGTQGLDVKAQR